MCEDLFFYVPRCFLLGVNLKFNLLINGNRDVSLFVREAV